MKNMHSSLTKPTNADGRGQVMVEFALVIPVLVLLLLGTIDLARAVYAFGVIANAARDGAHWASLRPVLPITADTVDKDHGDLDKPAVKLRARANTKTLEKDDAIPEEDRRIKVAVTCVVPGIPPDEDEPPNPYMQGYEGSDLVKHECDSWNKVTVIVKYVFQPITMFFTQFELKAESTMTIE